ncbi:hypothetical protein OG500_37815 [Kitasatospora sp. NBC_01250]|uniref:hypothetical protein n=1 Tax=unclassified Kitasatospora TaxID=2633591 RepID=UPI002E0F2BA1|nr:MULTISPECIES: hypothetical protein [unclassified Kitasatospora]WSJ71700.1 hypothetical protein OG294_39550 [Kitasatospora sp. NBC_01302]
MLTRTVDVATGAGLNQVGHGGGYAERHARLGGLCRRLTQGRDGRDGLGAGEPAERLAGFLLAELRGGRPPEELEEAFDELEELLLLAGHSAGLGSYRAAPSPGYQPLPGTGSGHPLLSVLTCPRGRCPRVEAPTADGEEPARCRIFDQPLSEIALRS